MKKRLVIAALLGVVIITLFWIWGRTLIWAPKIDIPEDSWDFGAIKTEETVSHTFIIKNSGNAELTIEVWPSCHKCIVPALTADKIPPKGEAELIIDFYVHGEGVNESYVMIESNDPKQRAKKVTAKAMAIR